MRSATHIALHFALCFSRRKMCMYLDEQYFNVTFCGFLLKELRAYSILTELHHISLFSVKCTLGVSIGHIKPK